MDSPAYEGYTMAPLTGPLSLLPDALAGKVVDFYSLPFVFTTPANNIVPAGGSSTDQQTIDAQQHFAIIAISGFVSEGAAITTAVDEPPLEVLIEDDGSGRKLSAAPCQWNTYVGSARLPLLLPVPKLIAAGSTLSITVSNDDPANTFNAWITLHGFKIFAMNRDGSGPSTLPSVPY
jgi:hypothetical protein